MTVAAEVPCRDAQLSLLLESSHGRPAEVADQDGRVLLLLEEHKLSVDRGFPSCRAAAAVRDGERHVVVGAAGGLDGGRLLVGGEVVGHAQFAHLAIDPAVLGLAAAVARGRARARHRHIELARVDGGVGDAEGQVGPTQQRHVARDEAHGLGEAAGGGEQLRFHQSVHSHQPSRHVEADAVGLPVVVARGEQGLRTRYHGFRAQGLGRAEDSKLRGRSDCQRRRSRRSVGDTRGAR